MSEKKQTNKQNNEVKSKNCCKQQQKPSFEQKKSSRNNKNKQHSAAKSKAKYAEPFIIFAIKQIFLDFCFKIGIFKPNNKNKDFCGNQQRNQKHTMKHQKNSNTQSGNTKNNQVNAKILAQVISLKDSGLTDSQIARRLRLSQQRMGALNKQIKKIKLSES